MRSNIREDFPFLINNPEIIYFDSGATSLKPQCVIDEVLSFYTNHTANAGRGDYKTSVFVTKAFEDTRKQVANFLSAQSEDEIVFTAGATDSLNMVTSGYFAKTLQKGDVVISSYQEHASSVLPLYRLCEEIGVTIEFMPLTENGRVDLTAFKKMMSPKVKGVFIAHISNVFGYENPIKEIANIAHEHGALISVDGTQSAPHIKVDVQNLNADFFSFSSHKMLGASGLGVLYGKRALLEKMAPLRLGGGANSRFSNDCSMVLKEIPYCFEAGTPPIEQVLALGKAIAYLQEIGFDAIAKHEKELGAYCVQELKKLDNVILHNETTDTGIVVFSFKDVFSQDAASYFSKNNIYLRGGNHCSKLSHHVLHTNDTMRASFYVYNTKAEIDSFIKIAKEVNIDNCIDIYI